EEAAFTPPQAKAPSRTDQINSSLCYGFVAEIAVVRIDADTRELTLERVVSVHDAGTILNQTLLEGQVHGALAHAIGGAMYEEMRYTDAGQPTATFMDYLCPTTAETTYELSIDHIETPSPLTKLGAKGCGEGSAMSLPVAIANAVADALSPEGIDITSLPLHGNVLHELLGDTAGTATERTHRPWH
ncbi:MAG: molybdopterin cofactor-binding domain-containing protein, partial [Sciscionella sp.]